MHLRGAVMITDDSDTVGNPLLLRRALQYARDLGILVGVHCDVRELSGRGAMHDGRVSYRLGLEGIHPTRRRSASPGTSASRRAAAAAFTSST